MSPGVREALVSLLSNGPIIRVRDVCSRGACLICCCRQQRENTRGFWLLSAQDPSSRQQFVLPVPTRVISRIFGKTDFVSDGFICGACDGRRVVGRVARPFRALSGQSMPADTPPSSELG